MGQDSVDIDKGRNCLLRNDASILRAVVFVLAQVEELVLVWKLLQVQRDADPKRRRRWRMPVQLHPVYSSATTGLRRTPTPLISTSTTSPAFMNTGGVRLKTTPLRGPAGMTAPRSSSV